MLRRIRSHDRSRVASIRGLQRLRMLTKNHIDDRVHESVLNGFLRSPSITRTLSNGIVFPLHQEQDVNMPPVQHRGGLCIMTAHVANYILLDLMHND